LQDVIDLINRVNPVNRDFHVNVNRCVAELVSMTTYTLVVKYIQICNHQYFIAVISVMTNNMDIAFRFRSFKKTTLAHHCFNACLRLYRHSDRCKQHNTV